MLVEFPLGINSFYSSSSSISSQKSNSKTHHSQAVRKGLCFSMH